MTDKVEQLHSHFKEFVKFSTSMMNALIQTLLESGALDADDLSEFTKRQISALAQLDQLEAAANDIVAADGYADPEKIRRAFETIMGPDPEEDLF